MAGLCDCGNEPPGSLKASKVRLFESNVKSVLLYGSETWKVTKYLTHKLQTFLNRCLRNILGAWWPNVIANTLLRKKMRQKPIDLEIKRRKWCCIGHALIGHC
ncbi:hypothetical protein ANN_13051 [Periplaneta americana]|uniref:Uncharacterized protein n=1 Tax=Periplaneta americana TaxID=6978 RepID=A0ABQ8TLT1_PERAM|nr:hypothetical protein ANN_13051 [Periplaneta americana]